MDGAIEAASPRRAAAGRHHATSCDVDFTRDELDFMMAMDRYKQRTGHPFPTWSEALLVLHDLGFRRVERGGTSSNSGRWPVDSGP